MTHPLIPPLLREGRSAFLKDAVSHIHKDGVSSSPYKGKIREGVIKTNPIKQYLSSVHFLF